MSNIQIRIDKQEKEMARKVFTKLGLDMSSAIKLFLRQVNIRQMLPFLLLTENGLTLEEEHQILKASQDAMKNKNVSPTLNKKEAIKHLKSL